MLAHGFWPCLLNGILVFDHGSSWSTMVVCGQFRLGRKCLPIRCPSSLSVGAPARSFTVTDHINVEIKDGPLKSTRFDGISQQPMMTERCFNLLDTLPQADEAACSTKTYLQ